MSAFVRSILLTTILVVVVEAVVIEPLDGNDWFVYNENQTIRVKANVPGSIYSDLKRADVLHEDLYAGFNDIHYRWVAWDNWTYTKVFDVNEDILKLNNIYLTCHGLDTVGFVVLNGVFLGNVHNSFVRYKFDVKDILRPNGNHIQVIFESAPVYGQREYLRTMMKKYVIPPTCPPQAQQGDCHVNFVRKMQSSFSWDWGPSFPTQGIWKSIEIEAFDWIQLRSVSVNTIMKTSDEWWLNTTLWLESSLAKQELNLNVTLVLGDHLIFKRQMPALVNKNGEVSVHIFSRAPSFVKPWFPNGVGEQHLYNLTTTVQSFNEIVNKSVQIGFRKIRLIQERLPTIDESHSFYFSVNNVPIFSKGSNWIPANVLHENYERGYIEDLLISAKLANMNMLRVWGGGVYEDDYFYELADQLGILIWQDMMFACALYPTDELFLESVKTEVTQQVRRLQHHPSIALWAGNNENEAALAQFWWPEIALHLGSYHDDYRTLYINTIQPIVKREDPTRVYLPSSPSNGIVSSKEDYISVNPQNPKYGDVHHYFFSGDPWNWKAHPSAKFVSEYGHQSLSSYATLKRYLSPSNFTYPLSDAIVYREHKTGGMRIITNFIEQNLPLPKNGSLSQFEDFVYLSQISQAMAVKIQTEFYRRNRQIQLTGEGFTMGALYWQLNDIWPTISWASIEFGGKWKMLHYYARNMFDNLLVDIYSDDGLLKVAIVRDDHIPEEFRFLLHLRVYKWSAIRAAYMLPLMVTTKPFAVTQAYENRLDSILTAANCLDPNECFVHATIAATIYNDTIVKENFHLLGPIKNAIGLKKANINIVNITKPVIDNYGVYTMMITLECVEGVAPFVWLDLDVDSRLSGIFSDNGFMLIGSKQIEFWTRSKTTDHDMIKALRIKSLSDVQRV